MADLSVGVQFSNFDEVVQAITKYQQEKKVKLWRVDTVRSERYTKRRLNTHFKAAEVTYACVHGGKKFKARSKGAHPDTYTVKQEGCPALIKITSKDGDKLVITEMITNHNHDVREPHETWYPQGVPPHVKPSTGELVSCPLCQRTAEYTAVAAHLQSHQKTMVQYEGYDIYKCHLTCLKESHYHCDMCQRTFGRKDLFAVHLRKCSSSRQHQAAAPVVSDHVTGASDPPSTVTGMHTESMIPECCPERKSLLMEVGKVVIQEDLKSLHARSNLPNHAQTLMEEMRKVRGTECVDDNKMSLTLEAMSSKKRKPNWTDQECLLLAQLMEERKDIVRGKCSTGVSIQDKRQAWEEITQAINAASPQVQRTASDCIKKWENLLAKSRKEIKMLKRKTDSDGLSLKKLSPLSQTVMNLSDSVLQDRGDLSTVLMSQSSCDEDGKNHATGETFTDGHTVTESELPAGPSISPAEQLTVFVNIPQSLTVPLSSPRAGLSPASVAELDSPCVTSPPAEPCTDLQERKDLEMSVLRRQEAVLKLQEEYYTLKN